MNTKRFLVLSILCMALGTTQAPAQGFLGKLKNLGKKVEQQVVDNVKESIEDTADKAVNKATNGKVKSSSTRNKKSNQSSRNKQLENQVNAIVGKRANRNMEDEEPTVRLPEQHTALFAPLGYDSEASEGSLTYKPVEPPMKASDQVAWKDKQPWASELTNASLVAEYKMICNTKADMSLSPASFYRSDLADELYNRIKAIENLIGGIGEAREQYASNEDYNWNINLTHHGIVRTLESKAYKALVRSSLEPLFTVEMWGNIDGVKKYFADHGGLKNAHKVAWTKWDPEPNKKQVSTSTGQKATVVSTRSTGSHIDVDGVIYVIHVKVRQAYVKETAAQTAVASKDIVIPDQVEHDGKMFPVTKVMAGAFEGAKIRSVKLPSTLKEIGNEAFKKTTITEVTIPASTKVVQGSAFADCPNLTKATFAASSMDEIQGCFMRCPKLQSVTFPAALSKDMSYDMFRDCKSLTTVVLPKNLRKLSKNMFNGCKSLTKLTVPTTVTKIDNGAFAGCSLTSLYLPNVTEISELAFYNCKTLKSITVNSTLKAKLAADGCDLFVSNFGNDNPNFPLKVSGGTVSLPDNIKVEK